MANLTHSRLREVLFYDQLTGLFQHLIDRGSAKTGTIISGTPNKSGYLQIGIDGELFYAHRLAWFYMTGRWPNDQGVSRLGGGLDQRP